MSAKYIIKILTLGDTSVGKSSIVLRFSDNKFDDKIFSTIGIDFKTKYIKLDKFSVKSPNMGHCRTRKISKYSKTIL